MINGSVQTRTQFVGYGLRYERALRSRLIYIFINFKEIYIQRPRQLPQYLLRVH